MENLARQLRVRFYGARDNSDLTSKAESSKSEKGRARWFGRQLSRQMSDDGQFEVVIAASAYAITALEEENSNSQAYKTQPSLQPQASLTRAGTRKEETLTRPRDSGKISSKLSDQLSMKKPISTDQRPVQRSMPAKVPSLRTTTPDKGIIKSKSAKRTLSKPSVSFNEELNKGPREMLADKWEKEQIAKIQKWYDELKTSIFSWENEKQRRAMQRLQRKEMKIERERTRVLQEYRIKIERINKIAGGARAAAEEKNRNEIIKTREKAKIIRRTGKVPQSFFCLNWMTM